MLGLPQRGHRGLVLTVGQRPAPMAAGGWDECQLLSLNGGCGIGGTVACACPLPGPLCPLNRPSPSPSAPLGPSQALTEQHKSLQLRYVTLQMKAQAS